jgi:aldehyde dehydrogenase (NAD+)
MIADIKNDFGLESQKLTEMDYLACFNAQKEKSYALRIEPLRVRKNRLKVLRSWIQKNRELILNAVHSDFKKPHVEIIAHEILPVLSEIKYALSNLNQWAKPKLVDAPITYLGTYSHIQLEPKGTALIIAPWNFPFSLCIAPLVSALAAGNTACLKPSEQTPNTAAFISKMISEIFPENEVAVFEGDAEVSKKLLELPFDHIFFTGSPQIGKIVMKAAAENLSSVTLELGGKSPVIVDETVNINSAAKRIAWGKFVNNGQICLSPDYALVHESISKEFMEALKEQTVKLFLSDKSKGMNESENYGRIVNDKHTHRLSVLIDDAIAKGAEVVWGNIRDAKQNYLSPTILTKISKEALIMQEEIFGPVLPVLSYKNIQEAVNYINDKPKPLALYVFSNNSKTKTDLLQQTSSGTAVINDCLLQFAQSNLPFGGVNNSGIGKSHGYYGFMAFSNEKAVLKQKRGITALSFLYPPYNKLRKKIVELVLKLY